MSAAAGDAEEIAAGDMEPLPAYFPAVPLPRSLGITPPIIGVTARLITRAALELAAARPPPPCA
jgi:hypothetical protein